MNRFLGGALALTLLPAVPIVTLAQSHPAAPPPAFHAAPAPAYHPAPPPAYHPSPSTKPSGFSLPHDVNVLQIHPVAPPRQVSPQQPITRQIPSHVPYQSGRYRGWNGPVIRNPYRWCGWCWNRGIVWYPAPIYWGGGFWGPWTLPVSGLGLFGSMVDYQDQAIYPSYEVEPTSPGAQLLQNYGLQQTQCGPPNLVVIWGPNDSVICAYPNNLVAAGNYELDPSTLTIQSQGTAPPNQ